MTSWLACRDLGRSSRPLFQPAKPLSEGGPLGFSAVCSLVRKRVPGLTAELSGLWAVEARPLSHRPALRPSLLPRMLCALCQLP